MPRRSILALADPLGVTKRRRDPGKITLLDGALALPTLRRAHADAGASRPSLAEAARQRAFAAEDR